MEVPGRGHEALVEISSLSVEAKLEQDPILKEKRQRELHDLMCTSIGEAESGETFSTMRDAPFGTVKCMLEGYLADVSATLRTHHADIVRCLSQSLDKHIDVTKEMAQFILHEESRPPTMHSLDFGKKLGTAFSSDDDVVANWNLSSDAPARGIRNMQSGVQDRGRKLDVVSLCEHADQADVKANSLPDLTSWSTEDRVKGYGHSRSLTIPLASLRERSGACEEFHHELSDRRARVHSSPPDIGHLRHPLAPFPPDESSPPHKNCSSHESRMIGKPSLVRTDSGSTKGKSGADDELSSATQISPAGETPRKKKGVSQRTATLEELASKRFANSDDQEGWQSSLVTEHDEKKRRSLKDIVHVMKPERRDSNSSLDQRRSERRTSFTDTITKLLSFTKDADTPRDIPQVFTDTPKGAMATQTSPCTSESEQADSAPRTLLPPASGFLVTSAEKETNKGQLIPFVPASPSSSRGPSTSRAQPSISGQLCASGQVGSQPSIRRISTESGAVALTNSFAASPSVDVKPYKGRWQKDQVRKVVNKARTVKAPPSKSFLWKLTKRPEYELLRCLLVFSDISVAFWEMERASQLASELPSQSLMVIEESIWLGIISDVICFAFVLDLMLRIVARGRRFFEKWPRWRAFNIIANIAFVVEVVVRHLHRDERSLARVRTLTYQIALVRLLRVVQIVVEFKVIRSRVIFRELRLMVHGLASSLHITLWSTSVIFFLCVWLSLFLTEGSLSFCLRHQALANESTAQLREEFGSASKSVLALYKAMSGGVDWGDFYTLLEPLGWAYQAMFLIFQIFSFVVVLNMVTAVFVESALERSKSDRLFMVQSAMKSNQEFLDTMSSIFRKMDKNCSGVIELSELRHKLKDKKVGAYFHSLGIDANQATNLFTLLDVDRNGTIDEKEFMFGCIRIKGEAKSLDVAIIQQELKMLKDDMFEGFKIIQGQLGGIVQTNSGSMDVDTPDSSPRRIRSSSSFEDSIPQTSALDIS